ncbi:MAG: hypothetical protein LLF90_03860 [Methanomicrobiaceae archaeon]|nr:hypothetical protein [Methanomicrobiaceae archaeon]
MGINSAFSSWLAGARSAATTTLRAAQVQAAAFQQQTMTALSGVQRAVTQPFQQQTRQSSRASRSLHTTRTLNPVAAVSGAVQSGARAVQEGVGQIARAHTPIVQGVRRDVGRAIQSTPAAVRSAPMAIQQGVQQVTRAHAPIAQGIQRDAGRAVQSAPAAVRSAPAAVQSGGRQVAQAHAPIVQGVRRDVGRAVQAAPGAVRSVPSAVQRVASSPGVARAVQATPLGLPVAAARAASQGVQAGRDIMGYSAAVDRYKTQESSLQRAYERQKPLYDQYEKNVKKYETSQARYDTLSRQYDQKVAAYRANPNSTNLAEVRMLEGNLRMLGAPLQAQYEQIQAQDRALTPLWRQANATESARREAEKIQAQDRGVISAGVIDALGAARMGSTPPASRRPAMSSEQATLYGVYPAAMGAAERWRSGVVEPFQRGLSRATGGRDLIVPQGAIDAVRHPVARGAITVLAPGMATTPVAMDLIVGAKQWAGHDPNINISRLASGVVGAPADLTEMAGMAIPGAEMAGRRVLERPSDLVYLPVAGMAYMGAGMAESFRQAPEETVGSLIGMGALTHGIGRVSAIPAGRIAKTVRPRITEARISSMIDPVDRPAFHAVSTIGRGIEGIRSDVRMEPRFGEVLNVGVERAPRLANVLGETPHSVYGSATRTGQMRPGSIRRQAQDVDVFTPDVDLLNLRIAQEFGRPYTVEGSTVVREVPGAGRVHAIDTHAIPEGYPLQGAGRGLRIEYAEAKVAPELPFEWVPKDLLKTGRITQEHLFTQVQRKAASVAGEPVEGGLWRFGPPEYRAGKDVFDLVSDAEYLINVEEARLPSMNPARRALVSRRLKRLREAVEEIKQNPTLSKAYQTELQKARKAVEEVAAEDGPVLRISAMPAPARRSPTVGSPSPLAFPGVSALLSADASWVASMPRSSPSPAMATPSRASGAVVSPSPRPARRSPSRSPSKIVFASPSPTLTGRETSPSILDFGSPSVVRASPRRSSPKASPAPGTERGSPSPGSPAKIPPSPYLYEPGGGIKSPSPRLAPPAPRPSAPPERRSRRKREEDDERRRRREYKHKPHWELGPAPGTEEMAAMIFGSSRKKSGSYLSFGPPSIGVSGVSRPEKPAHAGENRTPRRKKTAK